LYFVSKVCLDSCKAMKQSILVEVLRTEKGENVGGMGWCRIISEGKINDIQPSARPWMFILSMSHISCICIFQKRSSRLSHGPGVFPMFVADWCTIVG
jgi:hypothetical protein